MTNYDELIERLEVYSGPVVPQHTAYCSTRFYEGEQCDCYYSLIRDAITAIREMQKQLSAPLPEDVGDCLNSLETARHKADDEIHGYDYHTYCIIYEAISEAEDLIERLAREMKA